MNRPFRDEQIRLFNWPERLLLIVTGVVLVTLLGVAAWLEPNPQGFGTHQGLGLPQCSFLQLTGMRCPSCGMTTSWAHLVRGHILRSFAANSGGALLGLVAIVMGPWALISGLRGRWVGKPVHQGLALGMIVFLVLVVLVEWCVRCFVLK